MKYCLNCKQNVMPSKKFSIGWFLINCLWIVGGGVYLVYWALLKKKTCPLCGGTNLGGKPGEIGSIILTSKQIKQAKLEQKRLFRNK